MIRVALSRTTPRQHFNQGTLTFRDPLEALDHLVLGELAFGAQVIDIELVRIRVQTRLMDFVDTTVYSGPRSQMHALVELAAAHTYVCGTQREEILDEAAQEAVARFRGHPATIAMGAGVVMGEVQMRHVQMRACVLYAYGITDSDDFRAGLRRRLDDIVAASQLAREGLCTFREALAL